MIGSVNISSFVGTSVTKKKSDNSATTLHELSSVNKIVYKNAARTGTHFSFCCLISRICKLVADVTLDIREYQLVEVTVTGDL